MKRCNGKTEGEDVSYRDRDMSKRRFPVKIMMNVGIQGALSAFCHKSSEINVGSYASKFRSTNKYEHRIALKHIWISQTCRMF